MLPYGFIDMCECVNVRKKAVRALLSEMCALCILIFDFGTSAYRK